MQLNIVKEGENEILLELKEESVGFTNLVRNELWNDKSVKEVASIKQHPYLDEPKVFVKTERGSPIPVLERVATRIADQSIEFKEEFKRALKK